jgi:quinol monooxygenase YgiN
MIHGIATIEVAEGKREVFLEEFRKIIGIVRDEDGCIEYGPAVDLEMDGVEIPRPNIVTVVEKWTTVADLQAHLKSAHMATYRDRVKDIVKAIRIQVLKPA